MKTITFTLILAVCTLLVGCKNNISPLTEEEQKLVGKYCTFLSKDMEKSDTLPAMSVMLEGYTTYNADRTALEEGIITLAIKEFKTLKQPVVTLEYNFKSGGTWRMEDENIKETSDLGQVEFKFVKSNAETQEAETFVKLVKATSTVFAFKVKEFLFQMLQSEDGDAKIIELTDEKLVVEQKGEQMTMARVK